MPPSQGTRRSAERAPPASSPRRSAETASRRSAESRAGTPAQTFVPPTTYEIRATGDAAKNYDYLAARPPQRRLSIAEASMTIVKSALGAGVVSVHESYKMTGLWSAVILNVFLGIFVGYVVYMVVNSAQIMYGRLQVPILSYPDLAESVIATCCFPKLRKFSKAFRYLVDVTVMVDLFGSCVVYMVVMARTLKQIVEMTDSTDDSGIRIFVLGLLVPCILITWIVDIKYLQPFAYAANVFVFIVCMSTIYYGVKNADQSPLEFKPFKGVKGLFLYVGAVIFSMESVGAALTVENQLKRPQAYPLALFIGQIMIICIVMITGFFGYWGFGELSKSPITLNFPWSNYSVTLKVFMACVIYVTFALNFHIPFSLLWRYLQKMHSGKLWFWERLYRTIGVLLITSIAVAFPSVVSFIGLLGSLCLANMGFVYPALLELLVKWEDPGLGFMKWRIMKFFAILSFGWIVCIIGTYMGILGVLAEMKGAS